MRLMLFYTAAKQKETFFTIIQMRHCNRYFAIRRKTYAICANAFFVHRIGLFYAKCFFYHNDTPLS